MAKSFLSDKNLKEFINSLKIEDEQKTFLLNDLPKLNLDERLELLKTLKSVYALNQQEAVSLGKIQKSWQ